MFLEIQYKSQLTLITSLNFYFSEVFSELRLKRHKVKRKAGKWIAKIPKRFVPN